MKKNFIKSFLFAAAVVTMTFTACSSDVENFNTPNDNDIEIPKGKTLFSSGDMTGMPVINADADGEAKAMLLNGDGTRTSMGGKAVNQKFPFYWEPGDRIWVKNSNYRRSSPTGITSTQPSAQFMLDGTPPFTAAQYEVYYVGQNSPQAASETANALQVTIADQQVQSAWNKSDHLGTSGDCGSCYANLQGNGSYTFSMDHKASYLIFYPYLHTALGSGNYSLQKIEIYSDAGSSNIAGTYDFTFDGLADIPQAGTAKQEITLTCGDAFGLTTAVPDLTTSTVYNHCFMVIAPGTHTLTIKYTLKNTQTNKEYSFYKDVPAKVYAENSVYTYVHELRYPSDITLDTYYENNMFYQWGASAQYENSTYVYNTGTTDLTSGSWGSLCAYYSTSEATPSNTLNILNYIQNQAYWDNSAEWNFVRRDGTTEVRRGGAWIKKRGKITTPYVGSIRHRPLIGRPDVTELDQYFFLPAFSGIMGTTYFWTKTPVNASVAYTFYISSSQVGIDSQARKHNKVSPWKQVGSGAQTWWE